MSRKRFELMDGDATQEQRKIGICLITNLFFEILKLLKNFSHGFIAPFPTPKPKFVVLTVGSLKGIS